MKNEKFVIVGSPKSVEKMEIADVAVVASGQWRIGPIAIIILDGIDGLYALNRDYSIYWVVDELGSTPTGKPIHYISETKYVMPRYPFVVDERAITPVKKILQGGPGPGSHRYYTHMFKFVDSLKKKDVTNKKELKILKKLLED